MVLNIIQDYEIHNIKNNTFYKQQPQLASTKTTNSTPVQPDTVPMDLEILPNTEHQSTLVLHSSTKKKLNATATPYTPKGKNRVVSFAEVVKSELDDDSSRPPSPTPSGIANNSNVKRPACDQKAQPSTHRSKKKSHE